MKFKYYVPDGRFAHERNDCVVRSLVITLGLKYSEAHRVAREIAERKDKKGCNLHVIMEYFRIRHVKTKGLGRRFGFPTLAQIAPLLETGRYILRVKNHAFAVINGVQYDHSENGDRKRILDVYEF